MGKESIRSTQVIIILCWSAGHKENNSMFEVECNIAVMCKSYFLYFMNYIKIFKLSFILFICESRISIITIGFLVVFQLMFVSSAIFTDEFSV